MRAVAITLAGPLASWGDIAIGEVRPTLPLPTRSALLGLAAACMGIERGDREGWERVAGLAVAVQVEAPGALLKDYHTVTTPTGRLAGSTATRRDELYLPTATSLTYRDYLCDGEWTAVYWPTGDTAPSVEALAASFRQPIFAPFLGRKACVPMLPLGPRIVSGSTLADCLAALDADTGPEDSAGRLRRKLARDRVQTHRGAQARARDVVWCDRCTSPGFDTRRTETRHDEPVFGGRFDYASRISHGARAQHVGSRERTPQREN